MSVYLALGDSIISDCFPGPGRGAAALVQANVDAAFPEFNGRGLQAARFLNRSRTGHKMANIERQLDDLADEDVRWLLISMGGNDILLGSFDRQEVSASYQQLVARLRLQFPRARLALCNVYDPTGGSGLFQSDEPGRPPRPFLAHLHWLNELIATTAGDDLVDLHAPSLGHPEWFQRDIEPSQLGASEIRRHILCRLGGVAATSGPG